MSGFQKSQSLQLLQGGQALFPALIKAIDEAQTWVQLETYIFDVYGAGAAVAEALIRAARRASDWSLLERDLRAAPLVQTRRKK